MFSGIVECIGQILNVIEIDGCKQLTIAPAIAFTDLNIGDSVAINGVCLTITQFDEKSFQVQIVPETLRLTNLGHLEVGHLVNLERSITLQTRIGGHHVQGHVDGVGIITDIKNDNGSALLVTISVPENIAHFIVKKGYVTLDGMSITIVDVGQNWFTVTLIPHTQDVTIVKRYQLQQAVNIEVDILGKYIDKWLQPSLAK